MIDVLVIGAGPSGLSCALEAKKAGLSVVVLDKGSVVDAIRRFPTNLLWFSTPELLEIGDVPFVCATVRPTRADTIRYYQKVVQHHRLDVRSFERVELVARGDDGVFVVTSARGNSYKGRAVVVATGYFDNPHRLSVPGESLPNVFHYYSEPFPFFGCEVAVVGGRNSAVEAALDLYRNGARVTLIHRGPALSPGVKYWIQPDFDNRVKGGEIKALFNSRVQEIREHSIVVATGSHAHELKNDFTFVLIGYRPDTSHLSRWGVQVNPETLGPVYNEETFETNVPGLFVAGSVVAGKNNNKIFVENGRLHGAVIVKAIQVSLGARSSG